MPLPIFLSLLLFMSLTLISPPFANPDDGDKYGRTKDGSRRLQKLELVPEAGAGSRTWIFLFYFFY